MGNDKTAAELRHKKRGFKHSPGPYHSRRRLLDKTEKTVVENEAGDVLAILVQGTDGFARYTAQLFAASHDLLDVCLEFQAMMQSDDWDVPELLDAMNRLTAEAIAKATARRKY